MATTMLFASGTLVIDGKTIQMQHCAADDRL